MRNKYILFAVTLLAIMSISVVLVGYAPKNTPTSVPEKMQDTTPKKKSCSCCKERREQIRQRLQEARAGLQKMREQGKSGESSSSSITSWGQ